MMFIVDAGVGGRQMLKWRRWRSCFVSVIRSSYCDTSYKPAQVITHDHKPWLMYFNSITHVKQYLNIYHIKIIGLKAPKSWELDSINLIPFHWHLVQPIFNLSLEELFCFIVCDKSRQHNQSTHTSIYETIDCTVCTPA